MLLAGASWLGWMLTLKQALIAPHQPQQNGMIERVIRTLKQPCPPHHCFESRHHASHVMSDRARFYSCRHPHQALGTKTPGEAYVLAASRVQKTAE